VYQYQIDIFSHWTMIKITIFFIINAIQILKNY